MDKNAKIYVAGHSGMVGSAIVRELERQGYLNIVTRTHTELNLTRQEQVEAFFEAEKPEYVFLAAAKVGGIADNRQYPVEQLIENSRITINVMEAAHRNGCRNLLYIASNCIYPKDAILPLSEDSLMQGVLDNDWEGYGLSKLLGVKLCEYYRKEYNKNFCAIAACNLYGVGDCYLPEKSRVVASLIRRFHEAKVNNAECVEIWGTGKPLREFLFADDLADACIFLMNKQPEEVLLNIGAEKEYNIRELAEMIKEVTGYKGSLFFDSEKKDGIYRKNMDSSKIRELGWEPKVKIQEGLKQAYQAYAMSLEE